MEDRGPGGLPDPAIDSPPAGAPICSVGRIVALLGVLAAVLILGWISASKSYSIDEFDYAHAAWLVAQGEVPYLDFFDHHFPLLYQLLSVVFLVAGDDPETIRALRLVLLPVPLVLAWAIWSLNRRWLGDCLAAVGIVLVFGTVSFTTFVTEIRPDGLALALFLSSLAVLGLELDPRGRGLLAGLLLGLAVWSSQKVVIYGLPLAIVFVADLVARRRRPAALGSPLLFLAGTLLVGAGALTYLLATDSLTAFYNLCFRWSSLHESFGRRFSWWRHLAPAVMQAGWVFAAAAVGLVATVRRAWREQPDERWRQLVLALCLISAFASYTIQTAPYPYSLLPGLAFVALFGARGLGVAMEAAQRRWEPSRVRVVAGIVIGVWALASVWQLGLRVGDGNNYQHRVLAEMGVLTAPGDRVYANSGSFVTRPSVDYYYFTNAFIRQTRADRLEEEVPRAILSNEGVAFLLDVRFGSLPVGLKTFLLAHFVPYNSDLWLWGRAFGEELGTEWDDTFFAIVDGAYFVHPPGAAAGGRLAIDGRAVGEDPMILGQGPHAVTYRGPARDLAILWLPRNGERYTPGLTGKPRFSILF